MNMLVFSIIVLAVVVAGLLIAFLALARQVGVLFERVAPVGAMMNESGPAIGSEIPSLQLQSVSGEQVTLGAGSNRATLVFFLSPSCPVCKKLLPSLRDIRQAESSWLDIVLASDGDVESQNRFIRSSGLQAFAYVISRELGLMFRVARLPYAVLINANGRVGAKGLVNNREQIESLFNAADMKIRSIQEYIEVASTSARGLRG